MALKLALTDIDGTRRDDGRRRETVGNELRTYLEQFADVLRAPVAILDDELRVRGVNRAFCEHFRVAPDEVEGILLRDLGNGHWNKPELLTGLSRLRTDHDKIDDFPIEDEFGSIGRRRLLVNASRFPSSVSASPIIVLTMHEDGPNREG
jgi:two-component system CheB/CheR fusion protein